MSNDLWLNYEVDPEYFNMNDEERNIYNQGLKELAKFYYYDRINTPYNRINTPKRLKSLHRILERLSNIIYDENGYMTDLGKIIYGFSLLVYLFYFMAFLQATNITGILSFFIYLIGGVGGSWLISTKIFQLDGDAALKISGIISFAFPFMLLIGLFTVHPLQNYFYSVSSTIAHFLK